MKEDNNTNWWEKDNNDDDLNVNEEVSEQVEETKEEIAEDIEEEIIEEVAEAVSDSTGDYEVFGSDKDLVNHVVSEIHALGKTATVCDDHKDLNGGKLIILCGDNWNAFVHSLKANESSRALVLQFQHDIEHKAIETSFTTGTENITYTLGENKTKVAKRILSHL